MKRSADHVDIVLHYGVACFLSPWPEGIVRVPYVSVVCPQGGLRVVVCESEERAREAFAVRRLRHQEGRSP